MSVIICVCAISVITYVYEMSYMYKSVYEMSIITDMYKMSIITYVYEMSVITYVYEMACVVDHQISIMSIFYL